MRQQLVRQRPAAAGDHGLSERYAAMRGPMDGIRVVEAGVWVAGPAVGGILADWGADVVKIEPPEGDPARTFGAMIGSDLPINPPFELDNRGKRSISIDLERSAGRDIALELVSQADVFVTNMRVAALRRLGMDYVALERANPRLVYGMITGYGLQGPDKDRAAYDIAAFWARSGLAGLLTTPGQPPPFQRGGMGDHGAAATTAGAIGTALFARERTGKGQLVSVSLLRHGIYTIGFDLNVAVRLGVPIGAPRRAKMPNPVINPYTDSEGRWFWLVGLEADRHWPGLARAVGHPEWVTDERFATRRDRARNAAELIGMLDEIFATRTRREWGERLDAEDVWWAPVQTTDEVLADPQVTAAGALVEVPDGTSSATMVASPVDFDGYGCEPTGMPPELGEHTDEILSELGYDVEAARTLRSEGVVA